MLCRSILLVLPFLLAPYLETARQKETKHFIRAMLGKSLQGLKADFKDKDLNKQFPFILAQDQNPRIKVQVLFHDF